MSFPLDGERGARVGADLATEAYGQEVSKLSHRHQAAHRGPQSAAATEGRALFPSLHLMERPDR